MDFLRPCLALQIKPIFGLSLFICKKVLPSLDYLSLDFPLFYLGLKSFHIRTFKSLFGQFTILSLSFVTFRVSHSPVSHLTHETVKLCLQNTLNMSKTTRVYFGVLQFSPPYKNFVLEIHTLTCAGSISDHFFSCLLQKLERDFHLSHPSSIRTTSPVLIFQSWIGTYSF